MKLLFFIHILLLKTSNNLLLFQKISFNVQRLKISRKNESLFFTQGRYRMHSAWKSKVQNINGPHWDINNKLLGGWKILPCFDLWNYSSNIYMRYTSSWGGIREISHHSQTVLREIGNSKIFTWGRKHIWNQKIIPWDILKTFTDIFCHACSMPLVSFGCSILPMSLWREQILYEIGGKGKSAVK